MGLTSALNTSLGGLVLNETAIDVLGNNIANAGTNGFKASQVLFTSQLSRTLTVGSGPSETSGGTNPQQVGLGASTSAIRKNFTQGSITNSSSPSDLAIQGDGFFILDGPEGNVYSRNGNFTLSATTQDLTTGDTLASRLQNAQGLIVQGYGIDDDFNIIDTQLVDIEIPIGTLNVAQQTQNISLGGSVLSTGDVATQGSYLQSAAMTNVSGGSAAANPITAGTLLTSVYLDGDTTALFTAGQTVDFSPAKGGRQQSPQSLTVTAGTTVGDLLTLVDETIGIHSGGTIPNDVNSGGQPGVTVNAAGQIEVVGNLGTVNAVGIAPGDFVQNGVAVPITFNELFAADGESAITDFLIYDSLGQPIATKLTMTLESQNTSSTTFRYLFESADDSDSDIVLSDGLITFDGEGRVINGGTAVFVVDRNDTAANSPMQVSADLSQISGISTTAAGSTLSLSSQDGASPGTLNSFVIDDAGVVNGLFDNGIIRTLGQIVLARFSNAQGLIDAGSTTFRQGVASGLPNIVRPGTLGAGTIRAGAIELSNTDIGQGLVDLIVASTNYRGNARVISSVQELVDELLILGR